MSVPDQMIAIDLRGPGGPEMFVRHSVEVPRPAPGEVLIRVAAAGINAPDLAQRRGRYDPPPGASPRLGLEVGGEIAALGEGTTRYAIGAQVTALCNGGGYAEYVTVPEGQVLPIPAGWTPVTAAALPETFFTIQQTLVLRAGLEAGMAVLIHGAAGGIGGAAIGISRAYGARPIAVVSSAEKAAYAQQLGAFAVIDRTRQDFVTRTLALTDGRGVERIVDIVGGQNIARNFEAAAVEAHILQLATLGGQRADVNAGQIVSKRLTIHGSTLRPQPPAVKARIAASLEAEIWPRLASGDIAAPALTTFPLDEVAAAHIAVERPTHFGKTVLITAFGETWR